MFSIKLKWRTYRYYTVWIWTKPRLNNVMQCEDLYQIILNTMIPNHILNPSHLNTNIPVTSDYIILWSRKFIILIWTNTQAIKLREMFKLTLHLIKSLLNGGITDNTSGSKIPKEIQLPEFRIIQIRPQLWSKRLFLLTNHKTICYNRKICMFNIKSNLDIMIIYVHNDVITMGGLIPTMNLMVSMRWK